MKSTVGILGIILVLAMSGCHPHGGSVGIVIGNGPVVGMESSGPPPHAPAHGYRAKQSHTYYYYPNAEIYFSPVSGMYFYYANSQWRSTVKLSSELKLSLGTGYVTLDLATDRPYKYHREHVKKYPPGQAKKNKGKGKGRGGPPWR